MRAFFSIFTLFLLCIGCGSPEKTSLIPPSAPTITTVAVSLPPYAYFVKRIAEDTVHVTHIVPPQSNPHLFEPSPKQVKEIQDAKLWIRSHESFENKILTVLHEQSSSLSVVDLAADIPEEEEDRHIWLSPKLAQEQARVIAEALMSLMPQNKELYQKNLNSFIEDLQQLDSELSVQLAPFKDEAILTSHPAFEFFCRDYGLIQLSIECEGKDPLPQDLEQTLSLAKAHKVARILLQPQYNNRGAELIADHLSLPMSSIDPYSNEYMENLREIAQLIADTKKYK